MWRALLKQFLLNSVPMLLLLNLAGCISTGTTQRTEDVKMHDSGVFFPSLRLTHDLSDGAETESDNNKSRLAIALNVDYASGSGSQSITSSQFVNYGGSHFNGPAEIKGRGDLYIASLLLRRRFNNSTNLFGLDLLGGASFQRFNLKLNSDGISAEDGKTTGGPMIGVQFSVRPYAWAEIYTSANGGLGFGETYSSLGWVEFGISVKPRPHWAIMGGYRSLNYSQGSQNSSSDGGSNVADVSLILSGPVVGLQLDF
jgi:hypothetical protein